MGYIRHNAIIVTYWDKEIVIAAHAKAKEMFAGIAPVSEIMQSEVNRFFSFFVSPDGSKEGWPESNAGDEARRWLKTYFRNLSQDLDWVEVQYGGDSDKATIYGWSRGNGA